MPLLFNKKKDSTLGSSSARKTKPPGSSTVRDSLSKVLRRNSAPKAPSTAYKRLPKSSDGSASSFEPPSSSSYLWETDTFDPLIHPPPTYAIDKVGSPSFAHQEFGWCSHEEYRYTSEYKGDDKSHVAEEPPYYIAFTTYISFLLLIFVGHIRDFFGKRFFPHFYTHLLPHDGYAALNSDFDSFYTRRLKQRIDDCFSIPTTGVPGRTITTFARYSTDGNASFKLTGETKRNLNLSSYNYLGFAQATGGVADCVEDCLVKYGVSAGGARLAAGTQDLIIQAEKLVAEFIGAEDAMLISMGFNTNSSTIPALVGKGCLVLSDEYNHASIRFGVRLSGAIVRPFQHNNMKDLESLLREAISQGQPRTHRPWKKILVAVEGLYSMEGTFVNLPKIIELKKKYKFYLYLDEAHSIGAIGPNGRGVCDYFAIHPSNIDVLMGTFTKSFGAAGGYIAGSKAILDSLRLKNHAMVYAEAMAPPVLAQIIGSMASIMGVVPAPSSSPSIGDSVSNLTASYSSLDLASFTNGYGPVSKLSLPSWMDLPTELVNGSEGKERLRRIAFNSRYLHKGLKKLGFIVYGDPDSPIIPALIFNPAKLPLFSRMMRARSLPIVTVLVGYPACELSRSRVRFCVSSSHTKDDIDVVLAACDEIGAALDLKHGLKRWERWSVEEVMERAVELVNETENI